MENKDILSLLEKYDLGTCSDQERAVVERWYNDFASRHAGLPVEEDLHAELALIWNNIHTGRLRPKVVRFNYKKYALAAVLAIAIFGAGLFYFNSHRDNDKRSENYVAKAEISPGKMGATLTLANGKRIRLAEISKGEIAKEAGIVITKAADGRLQYDISASTAEKNKTNILSTSNGETYQVKLPDGTLVWLNAASSLTYTTALLEGGLRSVKLSGEAYFQVARDKTHPFVVQSGRQQIEVLGTHFNINAYPDEPVIATTLLEGSVKVTDGGVKRILKPGEQAVNKDGFITVSIANIEKAMDWKNEEFYMSDVNFKLAMRKIARWYDVEVVFNSSVPDNLQIGGWISRNEKLSSVLKSIESAGIVHFKVDGRKIYVSK